MYRCDTSLYLRYADERGYEIGRGSACAFDRARVHVQSKPKADVLKALSEARHANLRLAARRRRHEEG